MDLILKNADFSANGVKIPIELNIINGYALNYRTTGDVGELNIVENADRAYVENSVPVSNNVIVNNSSTPVKVSVLFTVASNSDHMIFKWGESAADNYIIPAGGKFNITNGANYCDPTGAPVSDISAANYYRIGIIQVGTGVELAVE